MYTISGGCMRDFTDACKKFKDIQRRKGNILYKQDKFRLHNWENYSFTQAKQKFLKRRSGHQIYSFLKII